MFAHVIYPFLPPMAMILHVTHFVGVFKSLSDKGLR